MATIKLWLGYGANAATRLSQITWTQIPTNLVLRGMEWEIGRSFELDETPPGRATVRLNNTARTFDPAVDARLTNYLPIRATITVGGLVDHPLWTMYVPEWPQDYTGPTHNHITLHCVDRLAALEFVPGEVSAWDLAISTRAPRVHYRMADGQNAQVAEDHSGNHRDGTYWGRTSDAGGLVPGSAASGVMFQPGAFLQLPNAAALPFHVDYPVGQIAVIAFWFAANYRPNGYQHLYLQQFGGDIWSIHITPDGQLGWTTTRNGAGWSRSNPRWVLDGQPRCVVGVWRHNNFTVFLDGDPTMVDAMVGFNPAFHGAQIAGNLGGEDPESIAVSEFASWGPVPEAVGEEIANALLNNRLGWAGDRVSQRLVAISNAFGLESLVDYWFDISISTLPAWQGGGSVASQLRAANAVEDGVLYVRPDGAIYSQSRHYRYKDPRALNVQVVLADDGTGIPMARAMSHSRPLAQVRTTVTGTTAAGAQRTVRNDAAIAAMGGQERTYDVGSLPISPDDLEARLAWTAERYGRPMDRIDDLAVKLGGLTPAQQAQILSLQLSDLIEVRRHPQSVGAPQVWQMHLEGYRHSIGFLDGQVTDWTWRPRLSPADRTTWWVLGTHRLNSTARVAY